MDITNYFNSDEFLDIISPLGKYCKDSYDVVDGINFFTKIGINYWRLLSSQGLSIEEMNNFMRNVLSKYEEIVLSEKTIGTISDNYELSNSVTELYIDELLRKMNLKRKDLDHPVVSRILRDFVINGYCKNDKFHAFNGSFLESICENGINPNFKIADQEELDMIDSIFVRHGVEHILGWQKLNCTGKVSYSENPINSYYYGVNSPEWFSQFTGAGTSFYPLEKYKKDAYQLRDYDGASNNLMMLMQEEKFSKEEIEVVMSFFDKYWNLYVNEKSNPMVAMMQTDSELFKTRTSFLYDYDYCQKNLRNVFVLCLSPSNNDINTSEVLSTTNAVFIRYPNLDRVMEKMNLSDKDKSNSIKK